MTSPFAAIAAILPSVPYPPKEVANTGYWLPVTSTINWCEEDYYATIYSAEVVNALTNIMFVLLALKGLIVTYRNDHDKIFLVSFAGYMIIGLGSFSFHSSLKYPWQLVDELSMIYTTSLSCFSAWTLGHGALFQFVFATALLSLNIFITAYYHYIQEPLFHQRAYAALTAAVLFRCMYLMEIHLRPRFKRARRDQEARAQGKTIMQTRELERQDQRDAKILRVMWFQIGYGLGVFLLGFAIWNLDNQYCSSLRVWRRQLGLPWGILLEGHGWWHIMTGVGAYHYIMWGMYLRVCLHGRQDDYELDWPSIIFSVPAVVKKKPLALRDSQRKTL